MSDAIRKENIIFREYKDKLMSFIKETNLNLDFNISLEVSAMLYSLGCYIISNFDSELSADSEHFLSEVCDDDSITPKEFNERTLFYSEIITNAIELRAECFLNDPEEVVFRNPILRCATAFCDILKNPLCFNDYENAPLMLIGFIENFKFTSEITVPIVNEVKNFANEIYKYSKSQRDDTASQTLPTIQNTSQKVEQVSAQPQTANQSPHYKQLSSIKREKIIKTIKIALPCVIFFILLIILLNFTSLSKGNRLFISLIGFAPLAIAFIVILGLVSMLLEKILKKEIFSDNESLLIMLITCIISFITLLVF